MSEQLWLELPPISASAPRRLMVFLHGEGSSPEEFAPVALSWQLKFPGATVLVMQGLLERRPERWDWFDPRGSLADRVARARQAAQVIAQRISKIQETESFPGEDTILVGFSQGGSLVLELARSHGFLGSLIITYSARLLLGIAAEEVIAPEIHLIHGSSDALVPPVYARQTLDELNRAGASATLDLVEEGAHSINQDMIIAGTTRAMQTVFRRRKQRRMKTLN